MSPQNREYWETSKSCFSFISPTFADVVSEDRRHDNDKNLWMKEISLDLKRNIKEDEVKER